MSRDWATVLVRPGPKRLRCDWCARELTGRLAISWLPGRSYPRLGCWSCTFARAAHSEVSAQHAPYCTRPAA